MFIRKVLEVKDTGIEYSVVIFFKQEIYLNAFKFLLSIYVVISQKEEFSLKILEIHFVVKSDISFLPHDNFKMYYEINKH